MNRKMTLAALACGMGIAGLVCTGALAQSASPRGPLPAFRPGGPGPMGPGAFDPEIGLGNKTGAPFSAQVTSEHFQPLSNGNQIDQKTNTTIYRDGQGRTRVEETLPFGPQGTNSNPRQIIRINDPVAGFSYILDANSKTARKSALPQWKPFGANGQPPRRGNPNPNANTQSLGGQTLGGVYAEGTQITRTIPAGQIGNAAPIQIVTKRWYSADLGVNVQTETTDPTHGNTSVTLNNISRGEPDASLFQIPSDYTVVDAGGRGRGFRPGPAPQVQ
jgi:hypothetical protein